METATTKVAKQILADLAETDFTEAASMSSLFSRSERLIANLAYLIGPLMDMESLYRDEMRSIVEAGESVAKAEATAKAGASYREWKKLEHVYDLAHERVMLIKKFADKLEREQQRETNQINDRRQTF